MSLEFSSDLHFQPAGFEAMFLYEEKSRGERQCACCSLFILGCSVLLCKLILVDIGVVTLRSVETVNCISESM